MKHHRSLSWTSMGAWRLGQKDQDTVCWIHDHEAMSAVCHLFPAWLSQVCLMDCLYRKSMRAPHVYTCCSHGRHCIDKSHPTQCTAGCTSALQDREDVVPPTFCQCAFDAFIRADHLISHCFPPTSPISRVRSWLQLWSCRRRSTSHY